MSEHVEVLQRQLDTTENSEIRAALFAAINALSAPRGVSEDAALDAYCAAWCKSVESHRGGIASFDDDEDREHARNGVRAVLALIAPCEDCKWNPSLCETHDGVSEQAALTAPGPAGGEYVLVPRDLRSACDMWGAGIRARNSGGGVLEIWDAMLAAAPQPASAESAPAAGGLNNLLAKYTTRRDNWARQAESNEWHRGHWQQCCDIVTDLTALAAAPPPAIGEGGAEPMRSCHEYNPPRAICVECMAGHPERCVWIAEARKHGRPIAGRFATPTPAATSAKEGRS